MSHWKSQTNTPDVHAETTKKLMATCAPEMILDWVEHNDLDELGMHMMIDCMKKIYNKSGATVYRVNVNSHKHFKTVSKEESIWKNKNKQSTIFNNCLDFSGAKLVQKPDGVFAVSFDDEVEILISYECDGTDKGKQREQVANKMWQGIELSRAVSRTDQTVFTVRSNVKYWRRDREFEAKDYKEFHERTKKDFKSYQIKHQMDPNWTTEKLIELWKTHMLCNIEILDILNNVKKNNFTLDRIQSDENFKDMRDIKYDVHMFLGHFSTAKQQSCIHVENMKEYNTFSNSASDGPHEKTSKKPEEVEDEYDEDAEILSDGIVKTFRKYDVMINMCNMIIPVSFYTLPTVSNCAPLHALVIPRWTPDWKSNVDVPDTETDIQTDYNDLFKSRSDGIDITGMMSLYDFRKQTVITDHYLYLNKLFIFAGTSANAVTQKHKVTQIAKDLTNGTPNEMIYQLARMLRTFYYKIIGMELDIQWRPDVGTSFRSSWAMEKCVSVLRSELRKKRFDNIRTTVPIPLKCRDNHNMHFGKDASTLMARCCADIFENSPDLDPNFKTLIETYNIPSAELFMKTISCFNIVSLQTLARQVAACKDTRFSKHPSMQQFWDVLSSFPVAIQEDLLHMMQLLSEYQTPAYLAVLQKGENQYNARLNREKWRNLKQALLVHHTVSIFASPS